MPEDQFMYNYKIAEPYKTKPEPRQESPKTKTQNHPPETEKISVTFVPKAESRKTTLPESSKSSPEESPRLEQGGLFDNE